MCVCVWGRRGQVVRFSQVGETAGFREAPNKTRLGGEQEQEMEGDQGWMVEQETRGSTEF